MAAPSLNTQNGTTTRLATDEDQAQMMEEQQNLIFQLSQELERTKQDLSWQKFLKKMFIKREKETRRKLERIQKYGDAETLSMAKTATQVQNNIKWKKKKLLQKDYEELNVAYVKSHKKVTAELQKEKEKNADLQEKLEKLEASHQETSLRNLLRVGTMESSSDEEEVRTFVQVISEKYNPENFPYGQGLGIVILPSPPGSLSRICTIVSNIPHLDFLNLSMNPLNGVELEPSRADIFSRVRRLVLINTHVSWDTVHTLTQHTPELEELFLCLNGYKTVSESKTPCPSLRLLQITDNQLQQWAEVRKFGVMYPCLSTLVLANNSVDSVGDTQETLPRLFPNLRSINLNNSGLSKWEDIERLNFFPKLEEVKAMGIPLLQPYTTQERRSLLLAQLPSVVVLNGGAVSDGEREDAERFFIRYYQDRPEQEPPERLGCGPATLRDQSAAGYHILVSKYGHLAPLAEVDLTPRCTMVDVRWGDRVEAVSLRLEQTVGDLKKQLRALLQLPTNGIRLFYINREMCSVVGPEELKCGCRALHSYSIRDGDEILVVPKVKSRCSSSDL
ncbi:hypothetical protein INR49_027643 [Caranx melampygus]|nr:hypothetical protein INR49_027643 [Caranx melampygus]